MIWKNSADNVLFYIFYFALALFFVVVSSGGLIIMQ